MNRQPLSIRKHKCTENREITGREKRIRTSGPCLPKAVLYQAELFPDPQPKLAENRRMQAADIIRRFSGFKTYIAVPAAVARIIGTF